MNIKRTHSFSILHFYIPWKLKKISQDLSPPIMHNVFNSKNISHHNLWQISQFYRPLKSVYHGTENASNLGLKIKDTIPDEYTKYLFKIIFIIAFIFNSLWRKTENEEWHFSNFACMLYRILTHFQPMSHFFTLWKHQKTLKYRTETLVENGLMLLFFTFIYQNIFRSVILH